jgi:hypothetical protein
MQTGAPAYKVGIISNGSYTEIGACSSTIVAIVAWDADSGKLWLGYNGTWYGAGDPGSDIAPTFTGVSGLFYALGGGDIGVADTEYGIVNFGASSFSYTVPSGFTGSIVVSASASSGGTISDEGSTLVISGTNKVYTITPNNGFRIFDVVVDGSSVGTPSTYEFLNITDDHTIAVTFTSILHPLFMVM